MANHRKHQLQELQKGTSDAVDCLYRDEGKEETMLEELMQLLPELFRKLDDESETDGNFSNVKVVCVGGGAGTIMKRVLKDPLLNMKCIAINTDKAALEISDADIKLSIGGRNGTGTNGEPEIGRLAAELNRKEIAKALAGCDTIILIACLGGGTGTGAAPLVAEIAQNMGISTIGMAILPFGFEGGKRKKQAAAGLEQLRKYTDTVIEFSNEEYKKRASNFSDTFELIEGAIAQEIKNIVERVK